jgi:hypothetical protein
MARATHAQIEAVERRIAYKLCESYGVRPNSFEFYFVPSNKLNFDVQAGVRPIVNFGLLPTESEFDGALRRALQSVKQAQQNGSLELRSVVEHRREWLNAIAPDIPIAKIIRAVEVEVETVRKVIVKHKRTGLTVTREAGEGTATWSQLVLLARTELTELVETLAAKGAREERSA